MSNPPVDAAGVLAAESSLVPDPPALLVLVLVLLVPEMLLELVPELELDPPLVPCCAPLENVDDASPLRAHADASTVARTYMKRRGNMAARA